MSSFDRYPVSWVASKTYFNAMIGSLITAVINLTAMQTSESPIGLAERWQRKLFVASVIFGVFAAVVAAVLAWLLWRANNRYQDAVKADADARIAEARNSAAQADKQAAQANERAGKLELQAQELVSQNLTLRGDLAQLETAAADARTAQAQAELRLKQLAERQKRQESFRAEYLSPLVEALKGMPTGEVQILYPENDYEASNFATTLKMLLEFSHWKVRTKAPFDSTYVLPSKRLGYPNLPLIGKVGGGTASISLVFGGFVEHDDYKALFNALTRCGFRIGESEDPKFEPGLIRIVIGPKD